MDAIALISHQVRSRKTQGGLRACTPAVLNNCTAKSLMSRHLTMTMLLSATLLFLVACASTPPVQEQQASYIVQGKDLITVTNAVRSVGGEITHELGIIRSVGAELTPSQVERLRAMDGLTIHDNGQLEVSATDRPGTAPTSGTPPTCGTTGSSSRPPSTSGCRRSNAVILIQPRLSMSRSETTPTRLNAPRYGMALAHTSNKICGFSHPPSYFSTERTPGVSKTRDTFS